MSSTQTQTYTQGKLSRAPEEKDPSGFSFIPVVANDSDIVAIVYTDGCGVDSETQEANADRLIKGWNLIDELQNDVEKARKHLIEAIEVCREKDGFNNERALIKSALFILNTIAHKATH